LQPLILASDALPDHLDDRARFRLWRDLHAAHVAQVEVDVSTAVPFEATLRAVHLGPVAFARMSGTINRVARTAASIRSDPHDSYSLVINVGDAPLGGTYRDRDIEIAVGGAFLDGAERQVIVGADYNSWLHIGVPRGLIDSAFPGVRDRHGLAIRPDAPELALLRNYLQLIEPAAPEAGSPLGDHVARTLVDLIGLATGARGDAAAQAGLRGVRAARLDAVLAELDRRFADPMLSARAVGQTLGLSPRYIQELLAATGLGFSDRLMTLRLDAARTRLAGPAFRDARISDIAFDCGFSDISYFNRSFRRRFGCTPKAAR
jgi:AraC-like DNA-binding protein